MTPLKPTRLSALSKEERERDQAAALREYQAERLANEAKTARLRALRLAKEARDEAAPPPPPPAPKPKRSPRKAAGSQEAGSRSVKVASPRSR
jgi:hypothetical protein